MSKSHSYMERKSNSDDFPHNTKERGFSLDPEWLLSRKHSDLFFQPRLIQILVFSAIALHIIFNGPHSCQSFNLSHALCNVMIQVWVELFLFHNWVLHAEKHLGRLGRTDRKIWLRKTGASISLFADGMNDFNIWLCLYY